MGQKVKRGDALIAIEAMKMETVVTSGKDGTIAEVIATVGTHVNTKDLLIVLKG